MSKNKTEQPGVSSTMTPPEFPKSAAEAAAETATPAPAAGKKQGDKLWTPEKRELKPVKLTAEQYVKDANLDEGIGGLIRSMYGDKIMPLAEWERTVKTLLARQVK